MTVQVMQPRSSCDREGVYRFLYEVWSNEFFRNIEGMDHGRRLMKDSLDETARHFIALDQCGEIRGCVRVNLLRDADLNDNFRKILKTNDLAEIFGGDRVWYASHFAVAPDFRGKTVASLLIGELYRYCLNEGALLGVSYCAPHLATFYYQLGYRPYTENFRVDAGIRIPIVHCVRDRIYLREIQSPLSRLCPEDLDDHGETAGNMQAHFPSFKNPGFSRTKTHHLWARLAHITPSDATDKRETLFNGLSGEELRLVEHRLSEVTFFQGDYVCRRGETEPWMGVLLSGSLGLEVPVNGIPRIAGVIKPGEPFGMIGSLGKGRRAASLVALEDSQAFLFPPDFLERVSRADPGLGLKLIKRLLKVLASRFGDLTDAAAQVAATQATSVRVKRPSLYQYPDREEIKGRIESYRFESLDDREGELKRLITQAAIGEDMEFAALDRIGLRDGKKILDLGSGPGVTSLIMTRRLPSATVIGVEPEDLLRDKAEKLVTGLGFGGRCRFLKGLGSSIPLDAGAVDFSYARFLFQHLPDPIQVLDEMKRVTCKGGIVAVLDVDDRTNVIYPPPEGLEDIEKRIAESQASAGGDRHVGRKLYGYMHEIGLQEADIETVPITASAFGRDAFFSIVYGFKRRVLERAGETDKENTAFFRTLEETIRRPETFAMTTVFLAHGLVP